MMTSEKLQETFEVTELCTRKKQALAEAERSELHERLGGFVGDRFRLEETRRQNGRVQQVEARGARLGGDGFPM